MKPGSIIVDLAAEHGGNTELTKPGEIIKHGGVTIMGQRNMPGRLAGQCLQPLRAQLFAFVETLIDKQNGTLKINWDDEIVKGTALTRMAPSSTQA